MNCRYCNKPCVFIELMDILARKSEVWHCKDCPNLVSYIRWEDTKEITVIYITTTYREERYGGIFFFEPREKNAQKKFRVAKMNTKEEGIIKIFDLNFHPDITPYNIEEKLPIYITFS